MSALKKCYNNFSIFRKIILWMLAVSLIPLVVMAVFSIFRILTMETSYSQSEVVSGLQWVENEITQEIDELRLQAIRASVDNGVRAGLTSETELDEITVYEMKKVLYNIALSGKSHSAYIMNFQGLQLSNCVSKTLEEMMAERVPTFQKELEFSPKTYVWGEPFSYGNVWLLPYTRFIEKEKTMEPVGVFIANYPESNLAEISQNTMKSKETKIEDVLILNDDTIISSWDKSLIGKKLEEVVSKTEKEGDFDAKYHEEECRFLSYKNEKSSDWCYLAVVSYHEIRASGFSIILLFVCTCVICIVFIVLASFLVSRSISKPLEYLSGAMQRIGDSGDLNVELKYPAYEDEIGNMWRCLIDMTEQLKTSIAENRHALEQNQRLRIETLQAQINPHFLYNTFGSIIYLIEEEKKTEAVEMLAALSDLLHISISRSIDFIRVEQELGLIRRYMDI